MVESTYPFAFISFQHQDYTIQVTGPDAGVVSKLSGLNIAIPEPYGTDPSAVPVSSGDSNAGLIAGGIAGVVLAAAFLIIRQRKKRNRSDSPQH